MSGPAAPSITAEAARRTFYLLTFTRWFPTGFVVGIFTLWALELGLGVTQALSVLAAIGLVVALLELPTSGFTDAFGRRPVYLLAAVVQVISAGAYLVARDVTGLLVAGALMGVFRALDSGPLPAWFVDAVHAQRPGTDVDQPLARAESVVGLAMAASSVLSGVLVWWHPFASRPALELPLALFVALSIVHLIAVAVFMREGPSPGADAAPGATEAAPDAPDGEWQRARASVVATPGVIASGLRLLRRSAALRGLVAAGALTSVVMVVQESLMPVRAAELLGGPDSAGVLMGPLAAVAWAAFAGFAALAGRLSLAIGPARTAMIARLLHCLGAIAMGCTLGPVGLSAAYLLTYGVFGGESMRMALIHRQATRSNRATVLSLDSMASFLAFAVASPALGLLAQGAGTPVAMIVAGLVGLLALLALRPALTAERGRGADSPSPPRIA